MFILCQDPTHTQTHTHTHTHTHIYIYIYENFIKHNRHFMSTYFLLDPFEFPYYFYRIRGNWFMYCPWLYVSLVLTARLWAIICPTLGHHLKQKLHHFCNRYSPDDGPKSGRKYGGYIQLWTIHKSIPPEYDKSNTGIQTDPEENM